MYCKKCGSPNANGARVCGACGAPLTNAARPAPKKAEKLNGIGLIPLIGCGVAFISCFLPWVKLKFGGNSYNVISAVTKGLEGADIGLMYYINLLLSIVAIAAPLVIAYKYFVGKKMKGDDIGAVVVAGFWALIWFFAMSLASGIKMSFVMDMIDMGIGFWLYLIAMIATVVGNYLVKNANK